MTRPDNYAPISTQGNGSTTVFTGDWLLNVAADLIVSLRAVADDTNETVQTITTDYTLSFNTSGFTVTFVTAPSSSYYVVLKRRTPLTQPTAYTTSTGFQGNVIENSLDRLTAMVQENEEKITRAPKFIEAGGITDKVFPSPSANKVIGWNSAGTALQNTDIPATTDDMLFFTDVASLVAAASSMTVNEYAQTHGYTTVGDAGGNLYQLKDAGSSGARPTEDGGLYIHASGGSGGLYFQGLFPHGVRNVIQYGAVGDGVTDDTAAVYAACQTGTMVFFPGDGRVYKCDNAHFPLVTGTEIVFIGYPTFHLYIETNGVDDGERAFWFQPGATKCRIVGDALIKATNNTSAQDGSIGNIFTFGKYVYGSGVDAVRTGDHEINGNITLYGLIDEDFGLGGNIKGIGVYGYTEDVVIRGVKTAGQLTYCHVCHWGQNISQAERNTTPLSTLPTKTWHPNRIRFIDCNNVNSTWPGARQFVVSAPGKIDFQNCGGEDGTPVGMFIYAGDLGYTYTQNLEGANYPQVTVDNVSLKDNTSYCVSVDMQTNPEGIFAHSTLWTSADQGSGGYVRFKNFRFQQTDASVEGMNFTGVNDVVLENCYGTDTGDNNDEYILNFYGCGNVKVIGGEFISNTGFLARDCGTVEFDTKLRLRTEDPDNANYGVNASANSETTTVDGAIAVGDTEITLDDVPSLVTGAGGYIRYTTGGVDYDIKLRSSTWAGFTTQTLAIDPSPVVIPDGATVSIIRTVDKLVVKGEYNAWSQQVRVTGSSDAKVREVVLDNTTFRRSGVYDVEIQYAKRVTVNNTVHIESGQRTTTTARRGFVLGTANADSIESLKVINPVFDDSCYNLHYGVYLQDGITEGFVDGVVMKAVNTGASNPAAVYRSSSSNVIVGDNIVTPSGVARIYPQYLKSFTPVFYGSSTAGSPTGSFSGYYKVMGDLVFVSVRCSFTSLGGMAGNLEMSGLPFLVYNNTNCRSHIRGGYQTNKASSIEIGGYFKENSDKIVFQKNYDATDSVVVPITDLTDTTNIYFSGFFLRQ